MPMKMLTTLLLACCLPISAQMTDHGVSENGKPLASPAQMTSVTVGGQSITIHYNSPSIRGRKVMGDLVPFGQVWRTGANPATKFETTGDFKVGDLKVPAGNYTLYTLPAAPGTPWKLILSTQTGQWGTEYHEDKDLGRTPMHFAKLPAPQEVMTISFEHTTPKTTELHVKWETTDEWVEIKTAK